MQVNIGAMQEFHVQITVCVACSVHLVQHIYVRIHKMKLSYFLSAILDLLHIQIIY